MADDEESTQGPIPGLIQDFVTQLQGMTERLESLTGYRLPSMPGGFSVPGVRNLPLPGALSSEQLTTIASSVSAQRRSIEAMQAQLSALDEQLAVLERILVPLAEWSKAWASLEQRLLGSRRDGPAGPPAGSG
jgi:uncharacterized coiled-coil protein SlyX